LYISLSKKERNIVYIAALGAGKPNFTPTSYPTECIVQKRWCTHPNKK
jgi:hypothetical protein